MPTLGINSTPTPKTMKKPANTLITFLAFIDNCKDAYRFEAASEANAINEARRYLAEYVETDFEAKGEDADECPDFRIVAVYEYDSAKDADGQIVTLEAQALKDHHVTYETVRLYRADKYEAATNAA